MRKSVVAESLAAGSLPAATEAEFDQLSGMIDSRDVKAAAKYMEETAGRCILLKAGIPVVVQDYVRLGVVRLRPVGETVTMVTNIEAAGPSVTGSRGHDPGHTANQRPFAPTGDGGSTAARISASW